MLMLSITEFLEARVAEDETMALQAGARAAGPNWEPNKDRYVYGKCVAGTGQDRRQVEHMARHDPARVLKESKAKRRIIAQAEAASADRDSLIVDYYVTKSDIEAGYATDPGKLILEALAAVYSDHPDYQQEWAL